MPDTITKTIGTSSRDYSTINAWEADLNSASIYSNGDTAIGEIYADSTFTDVANLIENGSAIGGSASHDLALIKLTVHADSRHDGTAGSGAVLKPTDNGTHDYGVIRINVDNVIVEWLEIDMDNDDDITTADNRPMNKGVVLTGTNDDCIIRNMLIHGKYGNPSAGSGDDNGPFMIHVIGAGASTDTITIQNNMVYNAIETNNDHSSAINTNTWGGICRIYNNTVYNIQSAGGSKFAIGIRFGNPASSNTTVKNNIVAKLTSTHSSGERAYEYGASNGGNGTVTEAYNLSDDTCHSSYVAAGTGSLTGKTLAQIGFVSTVADSEDLHISSDSHCVDAGEDLGTTNGVEIDINGRNRDSSGDTWDIGAHEFVADAAAGAAFIMFVH